MVSHTHFLTKYNFRCQALTIFSCLIWDTVPQLPTSSSRSPNSLTLKFRPFEGLTQEIQYFLSKDMTTKGNVTSDSSTCDVVTRTCSVEGLLPGRAYSFNLRACFTPPSEAEICGSLSTSISDWTNPSSSFLYRYLHWVL